MKPTPIALMSLFENSARKDFERRLQQVRGGYFRLLSESRSEPSLDMRELSAELMTMPDGERYTLLHRIMPNTDGPVTLEGMEALQSFVVNFMLDDGECMVVPEPDAEDLDEDPRFTTILSLVRGDEDNEGLDEAALRSKALTAYAERERPLVVIPANADNRSAGPADLLAAIGHNRAIEERRRADYEAFMADEEPAGPRL